MKLCECGCGKLVAGRYVIGHHRRKSHLRFIVDEKMCFVWQGWKNQFGYGLMTINRKTTCAHRYYYEKEIGPIPKGLEVDHLCKNKSCVNPKHMELVTRSVNVKRAKDKNWNPDIARLNNLREAL